MDCIDRASADERPDVVRFLAGSRTDVRISDENRTSRGGSSGARSDDEAWSRKPDLRRAGAQRRVEMAQPISIGSESVRELLGRLACGFDSNVEHWCWKPS